MLLSRNARLVVRVPQRFPILYARSKQLEAQSADVRDAMTPTERYILNKTASIPLCSDHCAKNCKTVLNGTGILDFLLFISNNAYELIFLLAKRKKLLTLVLRRRSFFNETVRYDYTIHLANLRFYSL